MTRRWKDHRQLLNLTRLLLVDEIHTLHEPKRGACLEAVISRMKALLQHPSSSSASSSSVGASQIRFIAISATVPNVQDIARWLGRGDGVPGDYAEVRFFGPEYRPVPLQKEVIGYPGKSENPFLFEKTLDYRSVFPCSYLASIIFANHSFAHTTLRVMDIIQRFAASKPTLVFCATRKSASCLAEHLCKEAQQLSPHPFIKSAQHADQLRAMSRKFKDRKMAGTALITYFKHHLILIFNLFSNPRTHSVRRMLPPRGPRSLRPHRLRGILPLGTRLGSLYHQHSSRWRQPPRTPRHHQKHSGLRR